MSNRKYPRLADGYHDRSQYPPYQTSNKYSSKNHSNCNTDGRERDRSPVGGSSNNRGSSPYGSRHTNSSPRSHRSKSSIRSRESGKRGSSKSPTDVNTNSHGSERHSKPNHVSNDEAFTWTQHVSSSGKVYYYNSKTEKSQWEKPKDWLEREKREKERKEKEKRDLGGSKDGRESAFYREHMAFAKTGKYVSPSKGGQREYHSSIDKRDGNHVESRNSSNDQRKEMQRLSESDRGYVVVKTCSAHTTALPTVVHRSTPIATVFGGETTVSPAGSLQDVSPPTTPSSRPSLYEPSSHTPSPNVATAVSPHVAQLPAAHSPQLHYNQQSPQFPPRHGLPIAQNRFPQVAISVPPGAPSQHHFTPRQYCGPQQAPHPQINNYRQYSHVNSSGPPLPHMVQQVNSAPLPVVAHPVPSQRPVMFNAQVSPQPALHPLQQATLVLQQRKLSEAQAVANVQQPYSPASVHPRPVLSPIPGSLHVKDDRSHHSSPGSPVVFAHSSLKEQMPTQLYPHHNSQQLNAVPAGGSPVGSSGSHAQPSSLPSPVHIQQQPTTSVNLQAVAKYVDKNLANHVSGWPTEMLDRQLQKLGDDTTCYSNDSDKAKIEQIQLQSEIGFMELRLETASKRISSLKGLTRTLEALLAESDVKFLS